MTTNLKPCPFCGFPAHEMQFPEGGGADKYCCSNFSGSCVATFIEAARDEWNTRTIDPNRWSGTFGCDNYLVSTSEKYP